jgi:EpsI family protein
VDHVIDKAHFPRAIIFAFILMLSGVALSEWLKPTHVLADDLPPIELQSMIPAQFGDWHEDKSGPPVVFDPTIEAALNVIYSQTLNRTYVNSKGQTVMLALAYGRNQNSWSTAAHRPEFCYRAQGFEVSEKGPSPFLLNGYQISALRLVASKGAQVEPISYWVTLSDSVATPGLSRKLKQVQYGLQGWIVDGFLVRLSSRGQNAEQEYVLHEKFARDLAASLDASLRVRLFGKSN